MSELDFRNYLLTLPNPIAQDWGDRYTPTEAELPLNVQTLTSRQNDLTQEQRESPKRYEVLAGLWEHAADHVLLVGKPGSGKSTALRRLLWEEAQTALEAVERGHADFTIPVLIELRDRREGSVLNWIQKALRRIRISEEAVEDLLLDGRFLLLFDGLNEIPSSDMWSTLDEFQRDRDFQTNPRVFTTRELGGGADLGIEKKLEMLPLTEPQMREFIELRLPGHSDRLLHQLKDRLRELAETPLILQMLCDVVRESPDGQLPQNRGELFRLEFARRYETFKPLRGRVSDRLRLLTPKLLQHLAFIMTQGEPHTDPCKPTLSWLSIPKSTATSILATYLANGEAPNVETEVEMMSWLEAMISHHLLQLATNPDEIEFRHQLFQEYYAAEKLLELLPTLSDDELKQDYLNYLKWTQVLLFSISLPDNHEAKFRILDQVLEVDSKFCAELSSLSGLIHPRNIENWILYFQELKSRLLDELQERNIPLDFIIPQTPIKRLNPFLNSFSQETPVEHLTELLTDINPETRFNAARRLAFRHDKRAIPALVKALKDKHEKVVETTILALGNAKANEAISELLNILKTSTNHNIQLAAGLAIGNIGSLESVSELIELLRSSNKYIQRASAFALGKINDERAVLALSERLIEDDNGCPTEILSLLWGIASEQSVPYLLKALDHNTANRRYIICVLGRIRSDQAVTKLCDFLDDQDHDVAVQSVDALMSIGQPKLLTILWELQLTTNDWYLQLYAYFAVQQIQRKCGFYNYEIAQAAAERGNRQKAEGEIEGMKIANVYIESLEKLEVQEVGNMFTGTIEIQGDQVAVKYELPQQEGECSE
jgi:HEAT repeat protein